MWRMEGKIILCIKIIFILFYFYFKFKQLKFKYSFYVFAIIGGLLLLKVFMEVNFFKNKLHFFIIIIILLKIKRIYLGIKLFKASN
jgi:hypothetical protein